MRNAERPTASYEAYCFNCKVTFPIETKQCLHCGGRTSSAAPMRSGGAVDSIAKQLAEAARRRDSFSGSGGPIAKQKKPSFQETGGAGLPGTPPVIGLPDDDVEEMLPARRSSPLTMIWIVLALAGATIRACSGGG